MSYALTLNGLTVRRFDTPEQREDYVANLVWDWLGQDASFGAEYLKDAVLLTDGKGKKTTIYYVKESDDE